MVMSYTMCDSDSRKGTTWLGDPVDDANCSIGGDPAISDECRLLLGHVRDIVMFVNLADHRITIANGAAASAYGYGSSELIGMDVTDLIVPADGVLSSAYDMTRGGTVTESGSLFESVHRRRDGSTFPVEVNARIATLADQKIIVAVIRDITAHKERDHDLRVAHDELAQVFETAADGMRIINPDFTMTRVNRTFAEIAHIDYDTAVGMKCYDALPGPTCGTPQCALTMILRGSGRYSAEVEKQRPDGTPVSCLITAQPFIVDGMVAGIIEDFRDISERKAAEELARHLATHDPLTGLPNRLLFTDRLDVAITSAEREQTTPTLLFCDIDRFKALNDTLGHVPGDKVLISVGSALIEAVRAADTIARIGGDEFVVLLPNVSDAQDAEKVASKILEGVRIATRRDDPALGATISIGIASYRPGDDADTLMRRADEAMYRIKALGGDSYQVAED